MHFQYLLDVKTVKLKNFSRAFELIDFKASATGTFNFS